LIWNTLNKTGLYTWPEASQGSLEEWHNLMSEYLQDSDWPELVEAFGNLDVGVFR
jgi:hypothetical protein